MFTPEMIASAQTSVLCWLATADQTGLPNVSPKEIFAPLGDHQIIIANLASPESIKNIRANNRVAVSFVDILVQKGFQMKGKAEIITAASTNFGPCNKVWENMTGGLFPFKEIIVITVEKVKRIQAPRYLLCPETTEEQQIKSAREQYNL